jgi:hypothetical protein
MWVAMAKAVAVCALCIVSAAVGAAVDHYFAVAIEQGAFHLQQAVSSSAAVAAPAEMNVEELTASRASDVDVRSACRDERLVHARNR